MEKESNDLSFLFQQIIADIKFSFPLWEDFTNKAVKLHSALRCTVAASSVFLDAFQKLIDAAVGSRGANKDIGSSLTKLCLRHRTLENRLKSYTIAVAENLITPVQERIDDWKKGVVQLEKDRGREYKKVHTEMKKASQETCRLQKKVNKGKLEYRGQLEVATKEFNTKFSALEATEKNSVLLAAMEERSHLCLLIECLKPVLELEVAMIFEAEQLKEIMDKLSGIVVKPPSISEEIQGNASRYISSNLTIERKKNALRDDDYCDSASNSSHSNNSSLDALNLCANTAAPMSPVPTSRCRVLQASASVDQPHTISYSHFQLKSRPSLSFDTYSQRTKGTATSKQESPYAIPTTLPSNAQISSVKVVDKIYSRPALILKQENEYTLKPVMTPTVPDFDVLNLRTEGAANARMKATENANGNRSRSEPANKSDEMSLADALRQLQDSAAQLQLPYESMGAPSYQSLQCSSGYGTMTNVSASSAETISSNCKDLDVLANALLDSCNFPDLDKYSTLPNKSHIQGSYLQDLKRHASAAEFKLFSNADELLADNERVSDFSVGFNDDNVFSSSCVVAVSNPLQDHPNALPQPIGNPMLSHLTGSIEEDDIDDLPLPPPPEELDCAARPVLLRKALRPPQLSSHADVMQSLNERFSATQSSACDWSQPYTDIQRSSSLVQQGSDETRFVSSQRIHFDQRDALEDNAPETDSFEHMIRRGVKLRHTICHDRSAPRVKKY